MIRTNTLRLQQPYEYRPLRPGPNNIRLLQILPGTGNTDIFCQVFQYTLRIEKAFGLYEALSYVWGDSTEPQQIWVKNAEDEEYCRFDITRNLYAALCRLRDPDLPRTFWIDAVCINQDDLEERASQVQIMARIYAYAVSVSVWLGEEADNSSKVLDLLRDIVARDLNHSYGWRAAVESKLAPAADAIASFLNRAWFRRAWVVQEAAVARVVSVTCGDAETTGAIFASGMELALSLLKNDLKADQTIPPVLMFMNQSNGAFPLLQKLANLQTSSTVPSFNVLPLGDLLRLFQNHEATDQRDKIYALLGLSSDNERSPDLRPDYTKSWDKLFRQVITHVLGTSPHVSTWEDKEHAVISVPGSVLGTVTMGITNTITAVSPMFGGAPGAAYRWRASWRLSHHAGSIRNGDILVFFKDARRPSIIRPCGDHFDIIMISLPPPPVVIVDQMPHRDDWEDKNVEWSTFEPGTRRSTRTFNLVWDWTSEHEHSSKVHETLLDSVQSPQSSSLERRFNTIRVLDDIVDHSAIFRLLKDRPVSDDFGPMEKHLTLFDHVHVHWEAYVEMKRYLSTLHWCIWCMYAPINLDSLLDYWNCFGPLTMDLFDIIKFAERNAERAARYTSEPHLGCWQVEPWQYPLYSLLFPTYLSPLIDEGKVRYQHNGRYLLSLVLADQTSFQTPSEAVLSRLYMDPVISDKYFLILIMLLEHESTTLNVMHTMQIAMEMLNGLPHYSQLELLLDELSHSPVATYFLLGGLIETFNSKDYPMHELWREVLEPSINLIHSQFRNPILCELEVGLWINAYGPFTSVLRPLYQCLSGSAFTTRALSTHNLSYLYSAKSLARWVHQAFLEVIEVYEDRRRARNMYENRRRGYRSHQWSHSSEESSTVTVSSEDETVD